MTFASKIQLPGLSVSGGLVENGLIIDIFVFKERSIRTSYFVLGIGAKLQLRCKFGSFEVVSKLLDLDFCSNSF